MPYFINSLLLFEKNRSDSTPKMVVLISFSLSGAVDHIVPRTGIIGMLTPSWPRIPYVYAPRANIIVLDSNNYISLLDLV